LLPVLLLRLVRAIRGNLRRVVDRARGRCTCKGRGFLFVEILANHLRQDLVRVHLTVLGFGVGVAFPRAVVAVAKVFPVCAECSRGVPCTMSLPCRTEKASARGGRVHHTSVCLLVVPAVVVTAVVVALRRLFVRSGVLPR
jgi:hypothetical protein